MPSKKINKPAALEYNKHGQVRNPKTNRWVKVTGEVGKLVLADHAKKLAAFEKQQHGARQAENKQKQEKKSSSQKPRGNKTKTKEPLPQKSIGKAERLQSPTHYLEEMLRKQRQKNARRKFPALQDLPDDFESGPGYVRGNGDGSEFFLMNLISLLQIFCFQQPKINSTPDSSPLNRNLAFSFHFSKNTVALVCSTVMSESNSLVRPLVEPTSSSTTELWVGMK